MADIVLPPKLSAAARRALENARAAGLRFRKAQFDLRNKVLAAYYDYALTAELIRLEQANGQLLKTTAMVVEARNRAGAAGQQDLLKARNEVDLSGNDVANHAGRNCPAQRAALNALLGREPDAATPRARRTPAAAADRLATTGNFWRWRRSKTPSLAALAREIAAKKEGIALARLQYLPDFSVSAGTDLKGIGQSLLGMVTVPLLRHEAIDAAVAQSEANLRAAEAMRRQAGNDLSAQVVMDLSTLRDADRQLELVRAHDPAPRQPGRDGRPLGLRVGPRDAARPAGRPALPDLDPAPRGQPPHHAGEATGRPGSRHGATPRRRSPMTDSERGGEYCR